MARFFAEIPYDVRKQFEDRYVNTREMLYEMTEAGALVVEANLRKYCPKSWHESEIMDCIVVTDPYYTPSDGGVNTKVAFYGYFYNRNGIRTPAPLVVNVTEFGRDGLPYPKQPFVRKAFKRSEIFKAMQKVQKKYLGE